MSRTLHHGKRRDDQRPIRIRAIRRDSADLRRLARFLISLVQTQAEVDAKAFHDPRKRNNRLRYKDIPSDDESTDGRRRVT
jgi:hypothetical protein